MNNSIIWAVVLGVVLLIGFFVGAQVGSKLSCTAPEATTTPQIATTTAVILSCGWDYASTNKIIYTDTGVFYCPHKGHVSMYVSPYEGDGGSIYCGSEATTTLLKGD